MAEPTITCPSCSKEIKLTESLAAPLIQEMREKYQSQIEEKENDIEKKEKAIREREKKSRTPRSPSKKLLRTKYQKN